MVRFLNRHVLLPAYETGLRRRKTLRYWKELDRTQWLPRADLERMQFEALRRLVAHAYEHCAYYRQSWSQLGLGPDKLRSPEDFRRWPLIGRGTVAENRTRLRADLAGMKLISKSTGGSSGTPLHFDLNDDSAQRREAAWHRGYSWGGAEPGRKALYLWSISLTKRPRWADWKDRLYQRLYRRTWLNTFGLSEERASEYLAVLNRCRPDAIVAYTHSLYAFARMLDERNLRPFSPKGIVVGAEKLYSFQRQLIEKVFGAPVFETYGSREFMLIGGECDRHAGLHLTTENLLVEVLDEDGRPTPAGEEGNVVVTDLYNFGMPFVRYVNGDRAIAGWGTCACGRGLRLLKQVVGRRSDMIHTPDGRHISGVFFPHLMKDFPAVRRFLVVQDEPDHLEIQLVLKPAWTAADRALLERSIRDGVGPEMRLDLRQVDDIALTGGGKQRVVVNFCDPANPNTNASESGGRRAAASAPASASAAPVGSA